MVCAARFCLLHPWAALLGAFDVAPGRGALRARAAARKAAETGHKTIASGSSSAAGRQGEVASSASAGLQ